VATSKIDACKALPFVLLVTSSVVPFLIRTHSLPTALQDTTLTGLPYAVFIEVPREHFPEMYTIMSYGASQLNRRFVSDEPHVNAVTAAMTWLAGIHRCSGKSRSGSPTNLTYSVKGMTCNK